MVRCLGVCVGLCARPGNYSNSCCADLTQRDERASHNMAEGIGRTDQDVSSDGTVSTDHGVLLSGLAACRRHSSHPLARIELHKNKSNMQKITLPVHYSERRVPVDYEDKYQNRHNKREKKNLYKSDRIGPSSSPLPPLPSLTRNVLTFVNTTAIA